MGYYATSVEHLLAELERIDLLIRVQVWQARERQTSDPQFQGLYISEQELTTLLLQPIGLPNWARESMLLAQVNVQEALKQINDEITRCMQASEAKGITLRLYQLKQDFNLTSTDLDILLICLAGELDLRYERLYAYLQDDVTKKSPGINLALNILCTSLEMKIEMRQHFAVDAPLFQHQLLQIWSENSQTNSTLLGKYLKVDTRIVNYLLDGDEVDSRLLTYIDIDRWDVLSLKEMILPIELKEGLVNLLEQENIVSQNLIFYFQGTYGVGKKTTAKVICNELDLGFLSVQLEPLLLLTVAEFIVTIGLVLREALLQNSIIYWNDFEQLLDTDKKAYLNNFLRQLATSSRINFLSGQSSWEPLNSLKNKTFIRLQFPLPSINDRVKLWERGLKHKICTSTETEIKQLASKFRLSGGQINDAIDRASSIAYWRNPKQNQITIADLYQACRLQSNSKLESLARKIIPRYQWEDLILPSDRKKLLREICNFVKYSDIVYEKWGFESNLALGKGVYNLFSGPPGTGKTMTAEIVAGELGLDLYKIDLSTVVSKYIGETEKNLSRIFQEAETSNAILFFDEADALFGKRSQISDAHDRYANIEVSYLLQKLEEYEGIVILATNFRRNLDDAFLRRFHFTVEFALPREKERLGIWQGIIPAATPQSSDLDLEYMARQFEISGGNIRNIALAAAFLAADDGEMVTMTHLLRATRREYQKMGKVLMGKEFGEYAQLL